MKKNLFYYNKSHLQVMTSSPILDPMEKNWWCVGSSPQEPHKTSKELYSTNSGKHGMWSLSDQIWIGNGVTLHNILYPKH